MVVIDELVDEEVFSPQVSWAQRKETISLKVHIAEAKNPKIDMTENSFSLQAQGVGAQGSKMYKFELDFYKPIDVEGCVYKIASTYIDVQLTKQGEGEWWQRLLPEKVKKPHFLKLDFDRWKSESDMEDNDVPDNDINDEQLEQLKEALKADVNKANDVVFAKNFYLFFYDTLQLCIFFAIAMNCAVGYLLKGQAYQRSAYQSIGSWVVFAVLLSFMEAVHAFTGLVETQWKISFIQTFGRSIALLCLWLGGETVQDQLYVWGVYLAWSTADIIRYPVYMLQIIKREMLLFTWLRYHAWIILYPLGSYCECRIIFACAVALEENGLYSLGIPGTPVAFSLPLLMKAYLAVLVIGVTMLMRHMWKQRSYKFGGRKKLKPA